MALELWLDLDDEEMILREVINWCIIKLVNNINTIIAQIIMYWLEDCDIEAKRDVERGTFLFFCLPMTIYYLLLLGRIWYPGWSGR